VNRRLLVRTVLAGLLTALLLAPSLAAVYYDDAGRWPADWPDELEPYRNQAKTMGVATGLQMTVYEIPFGTAEEFEAVWPAILSVKSEGGTLTLRRIGAQEKDWSFAIKDQPCVRIYAPADGYASAPRPGVVPQEDTSGPPTIEELDAQVEAGEALRTEPPWPESAYLPDGQLAEYVGAEWVGDRLTWVPAEIAGEFRGFLYRARVDIELVVDGEVIDLNSTYLPADTRIIDERGLGPTE